MSYLIYTSSGTVLTTVATGKLNTSTTSLTLVGRNSNNYGQYFNQNFVDLLTNFAAPTYLPPENPNEGQLWYDTTSKKLKIYDDSTGFIIVNAPVISDTQPIGQVPGEFWYDPTEESLNFLNSDGQYVLITTFPKNDVSGWSHPHVEILDSNTNTTQVTLLKSYGNVIGALTTSSFTASHADSTGTFSRAGKDPFFVEAGLNIIGNIKSTGYLTTNKIKSIDQTNTLTVTVNNNTWTFYRNGTLLLPPRANGVDRFTRITSTSSFLNLDVQHSSVDNVFGCIRLGTDDLKPFDIVTDFNGSANTWRFDETGTLRFPDGSNQATAFTATSYISKATLKSIVAASTDFADFQIRIAAL